MRLELITPGPGGDGFMRRFLDRSGPGPHHLTFKVPSLDDTLGEMAERGIGTLGGRNDTPVWREAFLHPKQAGLGTLIQLAQTNDALIATMMGPQVTPDGYPAVPGEQASIAWIGLAVESAPTARELLTEVLHGEPADGGPGWARLEWGTGHALVLRDGSAAPGGPGLWPEGRLGVTHVMFGPAGLAPGARCQRLADDPLTGVPVFVAD
jgi:methylmalonyl-CoA/ethylmalonyl-CoA epimerase